MELSKIRWVSPLIKGRNSSRKAGGIDHQPNLNYTLMRSDSLDSVELQTNKIQRVCQQPTTGAVL